MSGIIFSPIDPLILIATGIILMALEALIYSFVIFWIGAASVLIGLLSYGNLFQDGIYQVGAISIISMLLLFVLRTKALEMFMKSKGKEINEDFFNEAGTGVIKSGKVYYKATYWNIDLGNQTAQFEEDEKVEVLSTNGSVAKIKKLNGSTNLSS